jgi:hypothetical protein
MLLVHPFNLSLILPHIIANCSHVPPTLTRV